MKLSSLIRAASFCASLVMWFGGSAWGADPAPGPNAAVVYWQSFASMPTVTAEQADKIASTYATPGSPISDEVKGLLDRYGIAMHDFVRAGKFRHCDWTLEYEQGPYLVLPHASKMRDMTRVALARARIRIENGNAAGAVDDVVAVLAGSRHVANSRLLISLLVGIAIEDQAINFLAVHMPALPESEILRLQGALRDLPPVTRIADCLKQEGETFADWILRTAEKEYAKAGLRTPNDWLRNLLGDFGWAASKSNEKEGPIDVSKVTPEIFRAALTRLKADYRELERIARLQGKERREQAAKFEAEILRWKKEPKPEEANRLLSATVLPGLARILEREEASGLRRQLLEVALAVQKEGPGVLEKRALPEGGKVEWQKMEGGFELRVKYPESDKSESLRIGPAAKEKKDEKK